MLPVDEVARRLGVSTHTVVTHVLENGLRSLDRGELIAAGDRETPLIREREMTRFIKEQIAALESAAKPIVSNDLLKNTPVLTAYAFVMALQEGNHDTVWQASSAASQEAFGTPAALAKWWSDYLDIKNAPEPGIASAMYPIGEQAVAVKYIADTPPSGGVMQQATVVQANPLALIEDSDGWRVDQPLQERCGEWKHIIGGGQPDLAADDAAKGPT